ncbi:MAG: porin family protein [Xanthobacteraceae bacterium]|nr:MAG: porin family protein [Xanthobacteraceae bacterium]
MERAMKKIVMGTAGLLALGLATSANAADMRPAYKAPPPVVEAVYNWTGFYVGAHAGYTWGTTGYDLVGGPPSGTDFDVKGGLVGGHAGFNWQTGVFVLGIEGDIDWTGLSGDDNGFPGGQLDKLDGRWQGSIRGRVGYAANNWLFYATAGWAFLNVDYNKVVPGINQTVNDTLNGWTAGLGVEYAFWGNLIGRAEYRYASYGGERFLFTGFDRDLRRTETHSAILGISYKFGGPVVARY